LPGLQRKFWSGRAGPGRPNSRGELTQVDASGCESGDNGRAEKETRRRPFPLGAGGRAQLPTESAIHRRLLLLQLRPTQ